MLILRVAEGNAFQTDTTKAPVSVLRFAPGSGATSGLGRFDVGGAGRSVSVVESLRRGWGEGREGKGRSTSEFNGGEAAATSGYKV